MRLTFIGSSSGVPQPRRHCSCLMVEAQGRYYFVDMGTMAIDELITMGIPVDAVKGIFFTHRHSDHTDGFIHFATLCSWKFKTADPTVYVPDMRMKDVVRQWLEVSGAGSRELHYEPITEGLMYDDGVLKVTAYPTQHCSGSYAFLLEADGKSVLVTGDLKHPSVDFPMETLKRPLDLIICEGAHFPVMDYLPLFQECSCPRICITHFSPRCRFASILELIETMPDREFFLSNDGLQLIV